MNTRILASVIALGLAIEAVSAQCAYTAAKKDSACAAATGCGSTTGDKLEGAEATVSTDALPRQSSTRAVPNTMTDAESPARNP